jgi:cyclopropane-fatty-acyl-phospholipid synthase
MDRASLRETTAAEIAALQAPASFKAICLFCRGMQGGKLRVVMPDGRTLIFGDGLGPTVEFTVKNPKFARRALMSGDIGFAEGFMAGEWDTPDLAALLTFLAANAIGSAAISRGSVFSRAVNLVRHALRANTRAGARRNIHAHYDLGNRFYSAWLDATMT